MKMPSITPDSFDRILMVCYFRLPRTRPSPLSTALEEGYADAVAFGRHYISNPDLPIRIAQGIALTPYDRSTFYGGGEHGYTDYPSAGSRNGDAIPNKGT